MPTPAQLVPGLVLALAACSSAPRPLEPRPGAPDLGDPFTPGHGNGGYDALHYDLSLDVDPASGALAGEARVRVRALHDLSSLNLDLHGLEVGWVRVDGAPATFAHEGLELAVELPRPVSAGAELELRVAYGGVPSVVPTPTVRALEGVGWMARGGGAYVLSQPCGAPSFFPVNDHPTDKATYDLRVTAPAELVVAAGGLRVSVEEGPRPGARTTHWRLSDPTASYLVTLAIAPFEVESDAVGDVPMLYFFHPDGSEPSREALRRSGDVLAAFVELFGPYPFESCGAILSDLPIGAALETQTRPVYGQRAAHEPVVAHELAHQWFGDSVGLERWGEIWLSEGFATYGSWLWVERERGRAAYEEIARSAHGRLADEAGASVLPPEPERLFSGAVYARGALALHALRVELGDEPFFALLRAWAARHRHGTADTEDLLALVRERTGVDARALLDAWLVRPTLPELPGVAAPPADEDAGR